MVHSMDRLARNLDDLRRLVKMLTQRGTHHFCERTAHLYGRGCTAGAVAVIRHGGICGI